MSTSWMEILALSQPKVPREIMKIGKEKLTAVAVITLRLSPSPWDKLTLKGLEEGSVPSFVKKWQAVRWDEGKRHRLFHALKKLLKTCSP